jgi:hypothetical protein
MLFQKELNGIGEDSNDPIMESTGLHVNQTKRYSNQYGASLVFFSFPLKGQPFARWRTFLQDPSDSGTDSVMTFSEFIANLIFHPFDIQSDRLFSLSRPAICGFAKPLHSQISIVDLPLIAFELNASCGISRCDCAFPRIPREARKLRPCISRIGDCQGKTALSTLNSRFRLREHRQEKDWIPHPTIEMANRFLIFTLTAEGVRDASSEI